MRKLARLALVAAPFIAVGAGLLAAKWAPRWFNHDAAARVEAPQDPTQETRK